MLRTLSILATLLSFGFVDMAHAQDQCNTTQECREIYKDATDCQNSWSNNSVCLCGGSTRCDAGNASDGGTNRNTGGDQCDSTAECRQIYGNSATDCQNSQSSDSVCLCGGSARCDAEGSGGSGGGSDGGSGGSGGDQCDSTAECRQIYGNSATDCQNSQSSDSVCLCGGSTRCDAGGGGDSGGGSNNLGRFDRNRDILLCNYDGKTDEDDLMAVAGWATMLSNWRFSSVNYHCTAGAYGRQGGRFLDEPYLFNLAFGGSNWSDADANWWGAVSDAAAKAKAALRAGGDVWVAEGGQSDFTADVVRRIKSDMSWINTKTRIHVVQHSQWNEDQTSSDDLSYVRSNTDYRKIADGNASGNGTPSLYSRDGSQWGRATSDSQVGSVWREARSAAQRWIGIDWDNEAIKAGGMDFSDTVECMYIFGFEGRGGGVRGFFDEFL